MLNYLLVPFHTRVMATSDYGVVSYLYAATAVLMVVMSFRFETAYFRFASDKQNDEKTVFGTAFWSVLLLVLSFAGAMFLFAPEVAEWINYPGKSIYVRLFASIVALDVLSEIPLARLRRQQKAWQFAKVRFFMISINIVANIFLLAWLPYAAHHEQSFGHTWASALFDKNALVAYVFWANLAASLAMCLVLSPVMLSEGLPFDRKLLKKMFLYAAPLIIVGLAGVVNESLDRTLLMRWLPGDKEFREAQIGIYSGCYKLAMLVSLFTQAYRYAVEPFFFGQAQEADAPARYAQVSRYYAMAGALAFAGVMLFLPWLSYFVAPSYRVGLGIVPILLGANILLGLYYNVSVWYRIKDQTALGSLIAVGGAVLTIVSNYFLIPRYGFYGAAATHLICYTAMTLVTSVVGRRFLRVPYAVWTIIGYIASAVAIWLIASLIDTYLQPQGVLQFAIRSLLMLTWLGFWLYGPERSMAKQLPVVGKYF